ncbi:Tyrosine-protein kinase transforming protein RYK, partial [Geodia barretti]
MEVFFIGFDNVGGAVWFRNSTFQSTNERALTDIQRVYPSVSYIDQILIVTWDRLHLLSQNYQTNTFQAVIATSGNETYIMYLYADGLMQWISEYGGITDDGMFTARVVYGQWLISATFELPGSETCSIIHITSRSNVGIPGMFVFDLDGTHPVFVSECEEGDVRLVDSNMNTNASGRVEMCLDNEWRVVGDETWGVEEATVVCRQLGLPTDVVVVGWNLKSAGVPISCTGNESSLMDCSSEPGKRGNVADPLRCSGGATTSTCLATDGCEDFLGQDSSTLPAVCFNRYGSCVPFSPYLLGSGGIPCDSVYESGTDYVYLKNSSESFQPLNVLGGIEQQLDDVFSNHDCTLSTVRMICHYYLPPCGNSTHFEPPTSVCSDACYLQSQICPSYWTFVESRLGQIESNPLNCSFSESILNPIPHTSCSHLGVYANVTIGLSQTVYSVVEEEGVAVVCTSVLSGTTSGRTFSISYQTTDGDARAPADYIAINGSFDITDSNSEQCVNISVVSGKTIEDEECFNYTIVTSSNTIGLTLIPNTATICISEPQEATPSESTTQTALVTVLAVLVAVVLLCMAIMAVVVIAIFLKRTKLSRRRDFTSPYEIHDSLPSKDRQTDILHHLREQLENKKMIYSKDQIQLSTTIGQGEFGLVYKGYIKTAVGNEIVAIKTGKALFSSGDLKTLAKEVSTMLSFRHINIMSLIGVCIDGEMPLLIMPFMSNGSVLEYVRKHKDRLFITGELLRVELQTASAALLRICLHIAQGMEYLSRNKFVHRDLAARNCMIDGEGVIKVADFGLAEDMYCTNYFRRRKSETGHEEKVPIRWMAPESIEYSVYTQATDVWSYGVTMWEIFTCGRVPYAGIHAMGLLKGLKRGERLEKPDNKACHDDIYDVMFSC